MTGLKNMYKCDKPEKSGKCPNQNMDDKIDYVYCRHASKNPKTHRGTTPYRTRQMKIKGK